MTDIEEMIEVLNSMATDIEDEENTEYHMTTVLRPSTYAKSPKSCKIYNITFNGTNSAKYCSNKCKMKNRNSKGK